MNVRMASATDIDALVGLRIAYLTEDNGRLDTDVEASIKRDLPGYYAAHLDKDLRVYLVQDERTIISCAFLVVVQKPMSPAFINGKTGLVLNVYTRPAHRRRGHARRLMQALLADATALGLSVVELQATDDGYPLYLSVGFKDDASKYHRMKWTRP